MLEVLQDSYSPEIHCMPVVRPKYNVIVLRHEAIIEFVTRDLLQSANHSLYRLRPYSHGQKVLGRIETLIDD